MTYPVELLVIILSPELNLLAEESVHSEHVLVFLEVMLQHDPYVRKGMDICHLLSRRLTNWRSKKFYLFCEMERCSRKRYTPRVAVNKDHVSSYSFITNTLSGGRVLFP